MTVNQKAVNDCIKYYYEMHKDHVLDLHELYKYNKMKKELPDDKARGDLEDKLKLMHEISKDGNVNEKDKKKLSKEDSDLFELFKSDQSLQKNIAKTTDADSFDDTYNHYKNLSETSKYANRDPKTKKVLKRVMEYDVRDSNADNYIRDNVTPEMLKYATPKEKAHMLKTLMGGGGIAFISGNDQNAMATILKSIKDPEEMKTVCEKAGGAEEIMGKLGIQGYALRGTSEGKKILAWMANSIKDPDQRETFLRQFGNSEIKKIANSSLTKEEALTIIRRNLNEKKFLDKDVTKDELQDCIDILKELTPEDCKDVISSMSETELKTLADEADSWVPGKWGGLDKDKKKELFEVLSERLNGKQLARMVDAFKDYSEKDKKVLFAAVAEKADPQSQLDLIKEIKKNLKDEKNEDSAVLIATIINGFDKSENVEKALNSLSSEEKKAVVRTLVDWIDHPGEAGSFGMSPNDPHMPSNPWYELDTKNLENFLNKVASIDDAKQKAEVFIASSKVLDEIEGKHTEVDGRKQHRAKIADSMLKLIKSDPYNVLKALRKKDSNAKALSAFIQAEYESGNKKIMDDLVGNLIEKMDSEKLNPKELGRNLGYLMFSTNKAIENKEEREKAQSAMMIAAVSTLSSIAAAPVSSVTASIAFSTAIGIASYAGGKYNDERIEAVNKKLIENIEKSAFSDKDKKDIFNKEKTEYNKVLFYEGFGLGGEYGSLSFEDDFPNLSKDWTEIYNKAKKTLKDKYEYKEDNDGRLRPPDKSKEN